MTDTVERSERRMAEVLAAHKVVHTDHAARILTCACGASLEFDVMDAHRARALSEAGIGWPGALSDEDVFGCVMFNFVDRDSLSRAFGAREEGHADG